jgi:hypothetical protein
VFRPGDFDLGRQVVEFDQLDRDDVVAAAAEPGFS